MIPRGLPAAEMMTIYRILSGEPPGWRCRVRVGGVDVVGDCADEKPPDGPTALRRFLRDARAYLDAPSFEYWAAATGHDPDSRAAETTYRKHGKLAQQLRQALGPDFEAAIRNPDQDAPTC